MPDEPAPPPGASPPATDPFGPAAQADSSLRMAVIAAYLADPQSDPRFADPAVVVKVLSQERAHQQAVVLHARAQLAGGVSPERRAELEGVVALAGDRQAKLFLVIKHALGKRGRTGGTGILEPPRPRLPAPSLEVPVDDVLARLFDDGARPPN